MVCFFVQKTAYEMRISDWSSDVCSSDLVEPTYDNIADGKYPGSRPLFLYVKKAHVTAIPGIKEYLAEFANAWGPDGYLIKRGLIAAPDAVRAENAEKVKNLTTLTVTELK